MLRKVLLACALLSSTTSSQAAPPSAEAQALAKRFGALDSVRQISLSPSGDKIALIGPVSDDVSRLFVADLKGDATPYPIFETRTKGEHLSHCKWATEDHIVCTIFFIADMAGQVASATRVVVISRDGKTLQTLTARRNSRSMYGATYGGRVIDFDLPGKPGKVLMMREFMQEESIGTNIRANEAGIGVEEVDVVSLSRKTVEKSQFDAREFITDGRGNVRIMGIHPLNVSGFSTRKIAYSYRLPGSREWKGLSRVSLKDGESSSGFDPYAVDPDKNVAYGFDDNNGFQALYSLSLDGSFTRNLLLSRSDVDVDGLIQIGRNNRVVGASYATERRKDEYFDPELKKLAAALNKALPGKPSVWFVDASLGEEKLLLFVSSDVDPGKFYLYTKASRQLSPLIPSRSQLDGVAMGEMKPVSFPAGDGTMIPGYLTLPPGSSGKGLPAIVMPHGGPSARDEWGFDWLVQYYVTRGFAVLQPNYRGSSGYGSAWYQRNGFRSWRIAVGDVNDAGRWLVKEGIAAPGKLGIVGWSYGGYAALQSPALDPDLFKAIVAIAPVTDLEKLRQQYIGYANYALVDEFIGNGPHVRDGSPAQNPDRIKAAVLLFHGTLDQNVDVDASRLMESKLRAAGKRVTYVEFTGLDHQLRSGEARSRVLAESDAFLRENLGLAP